MNNTKQQENAMISMTRTENFNNMALILKPNELKLFCYINSFMSNIRAYVSKDPIVKKHYSVPKHVEDTFYDKHEATQFKNNNLIVLSPDFIFTAGILTKENYSSNKNANYEARKLAKALVQQGILYKMKSSIYKDLYMINPLYIYWGSTFGDVYITYCEATNTPLQSDDPFLNKVYVEYYDGKKTYAANPLVYKEIESMYDNSSTIEDSVQESEPEIVDGPTSHFSKYYYSKSSDQFNSPYHVSYSYLKDQYDREQRGLDPHWLAPKVPYSLNLHV